MKIYVASSWRNALQPAVVQMLRRAGHEVYDFRNPAPGDKGFAWSELDPNWRDWTPEEYLKNLNHPISEKGFNLDMNGMKWADACVLLLPCGRSAHTEAGWFAGQEKPVYAYVSPDSEPELMYKIFTKCYADISELIYDLTPKEQLQEKEL
jgi:nucleoside 2-deoxyribosyltransferase